MAKAPAPDLRDLAMAVPSPSTLLPALSCPPPTPHHVLTLFQRERLSSTQTPTTSSLPYFPPAGRPVASALGMLPSAPTPSPQCFQVFLLIPCSVTPFTLLWGDVPTCRSNRVSSQGLSIAVAWPGLQHTCSPALPSQTQSETPRVVFRKMPHVLAFWAFCVNHPFSLSRPGLPALTGHTALA